VLDISCSTTPSIMRLRRGCLVYLRDFFSLLTKRIIGSIAVSFGTVIIIFFISHVLSPDPARLWAGPRAKVSTILAVEARYHLKDPMYLQFYYFLHDFITGNFGIDPLTGRSILSEILFYLPNTLELVLVSFIILIIVGVGLGYISGMRFSTSADSLIRTIYLVSWSMPTYLAAILAVLIFATYVPILPSGGMYTLSIKPVQSITGIFLVDSLLELNLPAFLSGLQHLVLPAAVLAFVNFGLIARAVRSSILNVRWSTYVKTARAKGLTENEVTRKHVLRNALVDATTLSAVMFGWLLTGTVVVEELFAWPGLGQFAYQAIAANDYPVLIPIVVVFTLGVIVANFAADVAYSLLDPRIAMGAQAGAIA
jgi:ABC-type dipeptide/oligopeptide/nickel transport system permease component